MECFVCLLLKYCDFNNDTHCISSTPFSSPFMATRLTLKQRNKHWQPVGYATCARMEEKNKHNITQHLQVHQKLQLKNKRKLGLSESFRKRVLKGIHTRFTLGFYTLITNKLLNFFLGLTPFPLPPFLLLTPCPHKHFLLVSDRRRLIQKKKPKKKKKEKMRNLQNNKIPLFIHSNLYD